MICSDTKLDSQCYKEIIDEAIAEGELKTCKAYQKWTHKVAETEPPTDPLVRRQKLKKQEGTDIVAVILSIGAKGNISSIPYSPPSLLNAVPVLMLNHLKKSFRKHDRGLRVSMEYQRGLRVIRRKLESISMSELLCQLFIQSG
ncbi:uncharacterized protein LOC141843392 [Curcuma longa]|uniref:uncharacterized protein LOC141843392 n=1 Tax=Curcuma longa TaxID=136217 RepID=UPI003D9DDF4C